MLLQCCSVLQCVAVCCSVLQCVAVRCSVSQSVTVCYSVSQCVAVNIGNPPANSLHVCVRVRVSEWVSA